MVVFIRGLREWHLVATGPENSRPLPTSRDQWLIKGAAVSIKRLIYKRRSVLDEKLHNFREINET